MINHNILQLILTEAGEFGTTTSRAGAVVVATVAAPALPVPVAGGVARCSGAGRRALIVGGLLVAVHVGDIEVLWGFVNAAAVLIIFGL